MKWFKHYSTAGHSDKLTQLKAQLGAAGYGRYWILLELLSQRFDGEQTDFVFDMKILKSELLAYRTQSVSTLLQSCTNLGLISHTNEGDLVSISAPILLKLQSRDFKRARSVRDENASKNKIKNKNNSSRGNSQFSPPKSADEFCLIFEQDVIAGWEAEFSPEYVKMELKKAYQYFYVEKNKPPSKSVRGWNQRMRGWLQRGWDRYAVNQQPKKEHNYY